MGIVASLFRDAVQVTPAANGVDALPAVSMVALPNELLQHIFKQACNPLEPRLAVALSSACHGLRALTLALLQQLRADHEAAAALCLKVGLRSCKELREAKQVDWRYKGLSSDDLALLGTLGSVLPALQTLILQEPAAGPDGMQRLAEGLGAGGLPAVTRLAIRYMHVGDAGASTLAAALGQGALLRLKSLCLIYAAIGDAGLVALAPALRRLPALEELSLIGNPLGDEGLAALVAPPSLPAGALPPTGELAKLKELHLSYTEVNDAGCAALAFALSRCPRCWILTLPALEMLDLDDIPASAAAIATVYEARANLKDGSSASEHEEPGSEEEEESEEEDADDEEEAEDEGGEEDGEGI